MQSLLDTIQNAFNGNGNLSTAFAKGCEVSLAADAEALPLCILSALPMPDPIRQAPVFNTPYTEDTTVQFSVYSTDPVFILARVDDLDSVFDRTILQMLIEDEYVTPDVCLLSLKVGGSRLPYRDGDDARVWRVDLFYKIKVQRNS